jgi:hypothetical protein
VEGRVGNTKTNSQTRWYAKKNKFLETSKKNRQRHGKYDPMAYALSILLLSVEYTSAYALSILLLCAV